MLIKYIILDAILVAGVVFVGVVVVFSTTTTRLSKSGHTVKLRNLIHLLLFFQMLRTNIVQWCQGVF